MNTATDARFMSLALALGARGQGRTWPNPHVGCVIVKDGRIVGRGTTGQTGVPHAEVRALAQAGGNARGATTYVTLEPCSHHGRTPPCAEALIAAGVARVVIGTVDPNPDVNGQGVDRLRSAGIDVETGVLEDRARLLHAGFLSRVETGRPRLTLKLAASLDGRIATATGESRWITSEQSRRRVHAMRARHDAVLVGGGTARADDPDLTVRGLGTRHDPVRVVMSRRLDLPINSRLAATARQIPFWIVHGPGADGALADTWRDIGARLLEAKLSPARHVDPRSALECLGEQGINTVFCEGGGALAASLLEADLVDELVVFSAGISLGAEGQPMIGALGLGRLAEAPRFGLCDTVRVGPDVMSTWRRAR